MRLCRIITKEFHPPQCESIAEEFRRAAADVQSYAKQAQATGNLVMDDWVGVSKNKFVSKFESTPAEIERYATSLIQMAKEIEAIKVLVEEEEWYEV